MGEAFALGCAVFWAFAVILLKRSGETVSPVALNLFRVTFSLPLLLATTLIVRGPDLPPVPPRDYLVLVASGILGIVIADTLFHKSLNMVGAGVTAIIDTFYSPITVLLAFLTLGERIGARDLVGMCLIMGAVLLSATLTPPPDRSRKHLIEGVALGILGLCFLALGIVVAKPVLGRWPVLWVATVRQAGSAAVLLAFAIASARRREYLGVWRPTHVWRRMVPATVLGSYLSLMLWIGGMKYTLASIAAILNQSSTVFILILSVILLHERLTKRKIAATLLALVGVLLVSLR
ncbi:MAG: DMT family transporter [Candidatus Eisenbacteria bacterium]|nr:DMT family transporter [Candidatus Eisenbacteria bacterium]